MLLSQRFKTRTHEGIAITSLITSKVPGTPKLLKYFCSSFSPIARGLNKFTEGHLAGLVEKFPIMNSLSECSGTGPTSLEAASQSVLRRVQEFEAASRLQRPDNKEEPMDLQWSNIKIDCMLGKGSFSVVYKARIKALSKRLQQKQRQSSTSISKKEEDMYAIKILSTETICCNESFITGAIDLALEAKILSKLQHENVIEMHGIKGGDIAESFSHSQALGGGFFLVLDLLEETLDCRLQTWREDEEARASKITIMNFFNRKKRTQKRLQGVVDRLKTVVLGVIRGMEYIHSKRIFLRDLKPHNIGFDYDGTLKIFDFGLAREVSSNGEVNSDNPPRCNTGIAGTLRYIAPENALGHPCGLSCDVYSFAILLYEIITLQVPFSDINLVTEFKDKVIRGRHRPDLKFIPSSMIKDLLRDCWDTKPINRPSFTEVRCIMEEIISTGLLTNEEGLRNFAFKTVKVSQVETCAECGMDTSAGSSPLRRLSGSHNHDHHHITHSHGPGGLEQLLKEIRAEEELAASKRAGMRESHHGGLNDQMRSLEQNVSFSSRGSSKVHPL